MTLLILICMLVVYTAGQSCQPYVELAPGVCNTTLRTCGIHPLSCNGFNMPSAVLDSQLNRGIVRSGYTILFNPCPQACDVSNCTTQQLTGGCNLEDRYVWELPYFEVAYDNIVFDSYYPSIPVLFSAGQQAAVWNTDASDPVSPLFTCSTWLLTGRNFTIRNAEFVITDECAEIARSSSDNITAQTPLVAITDDFSSSTIESVTVYGGAGVIKIMPETVSTNISGLTIGPGVNLFSGTTVAGISLSVYMVNVYGPSSVDFSNNASLGVVFTTIDGGGPTGVYTSLNMTAALSTLSQAYQCPSQPAASSAKCQMTEVAIIAVVGIIVLTLIVYLIYKCTHHAKRVLHGVSLDQAREAYVQATNKKEA